MKIIDWITHAYSINFEQIGLYSQLESSTIDHREEGDLRIIEDSVKYTENDHERYIPICLIANQEKLLAELYITIPVDLNKVDEVDILKVLDRMNHKAGPFSTYFDRQNKKIKIYSYLSYAGSYAIEDPNDSANFEVIIFSNILLSALDHAHYWSNKIELLENQDFVAEDVFKLIDKKVTFQAIK